GSLEIALTDGSDSVSLSAGNILETVARRAPGHRALVELVHWALTRCPEHRVVLNAPPPDAPQQWSHSLVSQDALDVISRELLQEGRTSVRVPVHVRCKGSREATPTFFDVFLERDDSPRQSRPAFFREQLS